MPTLTPGGDKINHLNPMNKLSIQNHQSQQSEVQSQQVEPQFQPVEESRPTNPNISLKGGSVKWVGGQK